VRGVEDWVVRNYSETAASTTFAVMRRPVKGKGGENQGFYWGKLGGEEETGAG